MIDIAIFTAFWLGILTAISPCPLATNIAAISFIGKHVQKHGRVFVSGLSYTFGRTFAYIVLGASISSGLFALDELSRFLLKYMNEIIGPTMILLGMLLLGWIGSAVSFNLVGDKMKAKAESGNIFWDFAIGVLFALSFCPASAGLFFAGLIPLTIKAESKLLLPMAYGIGTGLPVLFFAVLIAFGAKYVGTAFNTLSSIEKWIRLIAGILFILAGIYYCIRYSFAL